MPNFDNLREYLYKENIPGTALETLFAKSVENKKEVMQLLGLTPENDYRVVIEHAIKEDVFATDEYCNVLNGIRAFMRKDKTVTSVSFSKNQYTAVNSKNVYKLSKYLSSKEDEFGNFMDRSLYNGWRSHLFSHTVTNKNLVTSLMALVQPCKVYISANVCDLVANSSYSWGNCYNPNNCHFSAGPAHALDTFSVLIFKLRSGVGLDDYVKERYAGRAWAYVIPKSNFLLINRSYGNLTIASKSAAEDYISAKMSERAKYTGEWNHVINESYNKYRYKDSGYGDDHGSYNVYYDGSHHNVRLTIPKNTKMVSKPIITFTGGMCLLCGSKVNEGTGKSLCHKCESFKFCDHCKTAKVNKGKDKYINTFTAAGNPTRKWYCSSECASQHGVLCSHCGKYYENTDMIVSEDKCYCPTCYQAHFIKCFSCGKLHYRDSHKMVNLTNDVYICVSCIPGAKKSGKIKVCTLCGDTFIPGAKHVGDPDKCKVCNALRTSICECGAVYDLGSGGHVWVDDKYVPKCGSCLAKFKTNNPVAEAEVPKDKVKVTSKLLFKSCR